MTLKKLWILAVLVSAAGCGGSYCDRNSPCKNDVQPTPAQRDACRASFTANQGAQCFGEAVSYLNCTADATVCGSDGKTDGALTGTKIQNNCSAALTNVMACCTKNPTSTTCK